MHRITVGNYIAFGIHIISTQKRLSSDKKPTLSSPVMRNALTFGFKMAEVDTLIIHIRRLQVPTSYGLPEGGVSRYGWPLHEQHLGYHVCYGRYGSR